MFSPTQNEVIIGQSGNRTVIDAPLQTNFCNETSPGASPYPQDSPIAPGQPTGSELRDVRSISENGLPSSTTNSGIFAKPLDTWDDLVNAQRELNLAAIHLLHADAKGFPVELEEFRAQACELTKIRHDSGYSTGSPKPSTFGGKLGYSVYPGIEPVPANYARSRSIRQPSLDSPEATTCAFPGALPVSSNTTVLHSLPTASNPPGIDCASPVSGQQPSKLPINHNSFGSPGPGSSFMRYDTMNDSSYDPSSPHSHAKTSHYSSGPNLQRIPHATTEKSYFGVPMPGHLWSADRPNDNVTTAAPVTSGPTSPPSTLVNQTPSQAAPSHPVDPPAYSASAPKDDTCNQILNATNLHHAATQLDTFETTQPSLSHHNIRTSSTIDINPNPPTAQPRLNPPTYTIITSLPSTTSSSFDFNNSPHFSPPLDDPALFGPLTLPSDPNRDLDGASAHFLSEVGRRLTGGGLPRAMRDTEEFTTSVGVLSAQSPVLGADGLEVEEKRSVHQHQEQNRHQEQQHQGQKQEQAQEQEPLAEATSRSRSRSRIAALHADENPDPDAAELEPALLPQPKLKTSVGSNFGAPLGELGYLAPVVGGSGGTKRRG